MPGERGRAGQGGLQHVSRQPGRRRTMMTHGPSAQIVLAGKLSVASRLVFRGASARAMSAAKGGSVQSSSVGSGGGGGGGDGAALERLRVSARGSSNCRFSFPPAVLLFWADRECSAIRVFAAASRTPTNRKGRGDGRQRTSTEDKKLMCPGPPAARPAAARCPVPPELNRASCHRGPQSSGTFLLLFRNRRAQAPLATRS